MNAGQLWKISTNDAPLYIIYVPYFHALNNLGWILLYEHDEHWLLLKLQVKLFISTSF